jgi:hypothetical protein
VQSTTNSTRLQAESSFPIKKSLYLRKVKTVIRTGHRAVGRSGNATHSPRLAEALRKRTENGWGPSSGTFGHVPVLLEIGWCVGLGGIKQSHRSGWVRSPE